MNYEWPGGIYCLYYFRNRLFEPHQTPLYLALYWPEQKHFARIQKFTMPLQSTVNSTSCGFPQFSGCVHQSRRGRRHCPAEDHPMALPPWTRGAHWWNLSSDRDTGLLCAWTPLPAHADRHHAGKGLREKGWLSEVKPDVSAIDSNGPMKGYREIRK